MNSPLTWAAVAILAITLLCATNRTAWRTILTDAALTLITLTTACAPLIIRSLT